MKHLLVIFVEGQSLNPGDIRGQCVMTFEAQETVFPCKGRGMNDRDYWLAQLKDHLIKVFTHAESHKIGP